MLQLERLSKVVLLLVPLLGGLWGGGLWYRRSTLSTAVSSTCQECLAEGQDFCISTNSCIPRATMGCRGPEDHITGDPEFAKPGPRAGRGLHGHHHEHHHEHDDEHQHQHHPWHHHQHHEHRREGHHPGHSMVCPASPLGAAEPSQCEACLASGKDFCISSARCIERATFGCDGAEDHITGDPEFARPGPHHHEHHHDHDDEHHHEHRREHHPWGRGVPDSEHHHEHHGEHPGHSMVCPVPEQRVLPRGAGAREPRGCPCKHANARCTSASGEVNNEGDCEELWRACKDQKERRSATVKAAWEAALATEFGVEFAVGFGPGSAIESASVKLAGTAVFGEGTATEGHRMCPCGRAKKECVNPAGVKVLDGECAEKWEACAKQMRQKFLSPDSTDTKDGPCTEAKKKCWGHDGARSVEGECKELWTLCGKQVAQKAAAIVAENMGVESSTESGWERAKGWLGSMVSAVEAAPEESERDSGAAANAEQDEDPFAPYVRQMQGIP